MNPKVSPQREYQLKHRLVGAVIMISVAVLVIPWLLSRPSESHAIRPETVALSAAGVAGGTGIQKLPDAPQPAPLVESNASATLATLSDQENEAASDNTSDKTLPTSTGWIVQVGIYSEPANADAAEAVINNANFVARKTAVKNSDGGDATRIWLGPYTKKETADEFKKLLEARTDKKGFIKHAP